MAHRPIKSAWANWEATTRSSYFADSSSSSCKLRRSQVLITSQIRSPARKCGVLFARVSIAWGHAKMLRPISWTGSSVRLLDQTKLPAETVYLDITDEKQMHDAIRRLVVRGAPAIGIAAAFGVYLGVRNDMSRLGAVCDYLATSRPTAVNLFWA